MAQSGSARIPCQAGVLRYIYAPRELISHDGAAVKLRRQVKDLFHFFVTHPNTEHARSDLAKAVWPEQPEKREGVDLDRVLSDLRGELRTLGAEALLQRTSAGYRFHLASVAPAAAGGAVESDIVTVAEFLLRLTDHDSGLHEFSEVWVWCRQTIEHLHGPTVLDLMERGVRYSFFIGEADLAAAAGLLLALAKAGSGTKSWNGLMQSRFHLILTPGFAAHEYLAVTNAQDRDTGACHVRFRDGNHVVRTERGAGAQNAVGFLQAYRNEAHGSIQFAPQLANPAKTAQRLDAWLSRSQQQHLLREFTNAPLKKLAAAASSLSSSKNASAIQPLRRDNSSPR